MVARFWFAVPALAVLMWTGSVWAQEEADEPPPPPEVPDSGSLLPPSLEDILAEEGVEEETRPAPEQAPAETQESAQTQAAAEEQPAPTTTEETAEPAPPPDTGDAPGTESTPAAGIIGKPVPRKLAVLDEKAAGSVAILPFNNAAGNAQGQAVAESAAPTLVVLLAEHGDVQVVERDILRKILDEVSLGASGLVQGNSAVKMGQLLGARYLITGDVREANYTRETIKAYNINSIKDIYRVVILVRMVDAATGKVVTAKKAEEQYEEVITRFTDPRPGDRFTEIAETALKSVTPEIGAEIARIKSRAAADARKYVFKVDSQPEGADVEIDGLFEGNCPLETKLAPGVHEVKISLPGYELWEKKVRVSQDLDKPIIARLRPKPTTTEVNVNIEE